MPLNPPSPLPRTPIDYSDLNRATSELQRLVDEMSELTDQVADARTAIEFSNERCKQALATATIRAFKDGSKSAAHAEVAARANDSYKLEIEDIKKDYAIADRVRLKYMALNIKIDALRTLISAMKNQNNL